MRKFVSTIFIVAIIFGQDQVVAKKKHSNKKDITVPAILKTEQKQLTRESHLYNSSRSKIHKKGTWVFNKNSNKRKNAEYRKKQIAKRNAKLRAKKNARISKRDAWIKKQNRMQREAAKKNQIRKEKLIQKKQIAFNIRSEGMKKWKAIRVTDIQNSHQNGKFADLYKKPAWPNYMLYAERDNMVHATAQFDSSTNWFNSKGNSQDLSAGTFGEQDFYFRDILLALDLNKRTVGGNPILDANNINYPWFNLEDNYYNKKMIFHAQQNQFGVNLDYGRYVKNKDIFIGFEMPIAYKSRILKFDSDVLTLNDNAAQDVYLRTFMKEVFEYMLRPKGLTYREKVSIVGIGDISTFINFNVQTKYLEQFKWGAKVIWPVAKEADTSKLIAPELGTGFTQLKLFTALMFNKQTDYFNPHMFIEGTYFFPGHRNKRVPKVITYDGNAPQGTAVGSDTMALGDQVDYTDIAFSEPDTKIVAFADHVKNVKIRPGAQFKFRFGNIIEKMIFRRGFLDIYYDFRIKGGDNIVNTYIDPKVWQLDRLKENTFEIEHKLGADFSYQFDIHTRLSMGANYTFAGLNVADKFSANCGISAEF